MENDCCTNIFFMINLVWEQKIISYKSTFERFANSPIQFFKNHKNADYVILDKDSAEQIWSDFKQSAQEDSLILEFVPELDLSPYLYRFVRKKLFLWWDSFFFSLNTCHIPVDGKWPQKAASLQRCHDEPRKQIRF